MNGKVWIFLLCLLAFVSVGLVLFLTAGVPLDIGDDVTHLITAKSASWNLLFFNCFDLTFNPQNLLGDFCSTKGLSGRPFQHIALKIILELFGTNPSVFYFIKGIFFALVVVLMFQIVSSLTSSATLAFCSALFMFISPPTLCHVLWVSDFGIMATAMILVTVLLLFWGRMSVFKLIVVLVFGFLAIRTKLSGAMIFIILFDYCFLSACARISPARRFICIILGTTFFAAIVHTLIPSYNLATIRDLVFLNRTSGYEAEKTLVLFSLDAQLPVSVMRNFGMFMSWGMIFLVLCCLKKRIFGDARFLTVAAWLYQIILFSGFTRNEPRYLTDILIPAVILMACLTSDVFRNISRTFRYCLGIFLLIGYVFAVSNNFSHLVFISTWQTDFHYTFNKIERLIYCDYNKKCPDDIYVLNDFVKTAKTDSLIAYSQYSLWDKGPIVNEVDVDKVWRDYGVAYLIFSGEPNSSLKDKMICIGRIDVAKELLFNRFVGLFKKKTKPVLYVYKWKGISQNH